MPVKQGDKVKVEYEGTLEDGSVFDSTENHGEPLEFEIGSGQIIEGFEESIKGMEEGDEKQFQLQPSEAYGEPRDDLKRDVPKEQVPDDQEITPGMMLLVTLPDESQIPAEVLDVTEEKVTLDLNHPLAGKVLNFKVKIDEIDESGSDEESES
ncbi:peptidylprolyl isomerase [Methanohalobium sp.]|uniref:FKBP-type peptidyl-prolyl cis-trans isomerase n=1 Tax=Methanohalobium sp. TaxID=2837493 RepID=UPI0025F14C89|nr:peptidylprolyl isomerase [Methanohalobium sp.]